VGEVDRQRARRVFMEVADLAGEERQAALVRECGEDAALRAEVEALLAADAGAGGFMESPTAGPAGMETTMGPMREGPGTRIGPYKVLQLIGEGGFGSVFMAQQEKPVQRRVALKVIKVGMDTRQVVARFEQERQALALMDHPNIARVLDAGATETGRPYFVMELVKGDPIVEYCDKQRLRIEDRLRLFEQVCSAVQHAHSKGIIHRDIKPSNILVSTQDGRPFGKVIDFGIAKATSAHLTEKTLFTEHRQLIGTPEYMSPEQAEGSLDIDTRSDVYSLGVLLYELLTGATPFESESLRSAAYAEIQRIIREVEPPMPSTRLSRSGETIAGIAASRQTEPRRLGAVVRGELDWIVMKSLEKDRQRRYETANGLAMDVRRYLDGQPVLAAPPGAAYRVRKFVKRHRAGVMAAGMVSAALVLGMVGTSWGMVQASRERRVAEAHARRAVEQAERASEAERAAQARSVELREVAQFQAAQLREIDASVMGLRIRADLLAKVKEAALHARLGSEEAQARAAEVERLVAGADFTGLAREALRTQVLEPGLAAIELKFKDQPLIRANLLQSLADVAHRLDLTAFAVEPQREALRIRREKLGDDDPATIESIMESASVALRLSRFDECERLRREAIERSARVLGEGSREHVRALSGMAMVLEKVSRNDESLRYRERAYELARAHFGDEDDQTLDVRTGIAVSLMMGGRHAEAERIFREIVEIKARVYPPDSNQHAGTLRWLGICLGSMKRGEEGEPYQRRALELNRRYLGDDHATTMGALNMLGWLHLNMGRFEEAEHELAEAYERRRRVFGEDHQDTLASQRNLGELALKRGQYDRAEAFSRGALAGFRRLLGNDHMDTLWAGVNLGRALAGQRRYDEAEVYLREVLAKDQRGSAAGGLPYLAARDLAAMLTDLGRFAEGLRVLEDAYGRRRAAFAQTQDSADAEYARRLAGFAADLCERWDKAEPGQGHDTRAADWRTRSQE
jgi:eukaryotic-like serine/threonine-protein kinase